MTPYAAHNGKAEGEDIKDGRCSGPLAPFICLAAAIPSFCRPGNFCQRGRSPPRQPGAITYMGMADIDVTLRKVEASGDKVLRGASRRTATRRPVVVVMCRGAVRPGPGARRETEWGRGRGRATEPARSADTGGKCVWAGLAVLMGICLQLWSE